MPVLDAPVAQPIAPIITASSPLAAAEAAEAAAAAGTPATTTTPSGDVDDDFADEEFSAEQLACSIEAMRNGKDVIIDKPGVITRHDLDAVMKAVTETGRIFSVCFSERLITPVSEVAAKLVADGAVHHAIDLLRTNIPEPARLAEGPATAPGENWVTNPGRLTVIRDGSAPVFIPLHTGEVTEAPDPKLPRDAESVDLNQPLPGGTTPAITGLAGGTGSARPQMRVRWVNLLRDPSEAASKTNPLVARYAFWMDDESARLNFNTAQAFVRRAVEIGSRLKVETREAA
jgi:hypothetical protein